MSAVGDLLELLHGARDRWTTLRCTVRTWHHTERSLAASNRWVAASQHGSVTRFARSAGTGQPETSEWNERLWIAKPDRSRSETERHTVVARGDLWWSWDAQRGYVSNEHEPQTRRSSPLQSHAAHLDPGVLIPQIEIESVDAQVVRVRPRTSETFSPGLPQGADSHTLAVDRRGVVIRIESLLDGEPFFRSELVEPVWDEEIPDSVFMLEIPEGVEVAAPGDLHAGDLSVDAAAERVGFALWTLAELPDGVWRVRAHHQRARGDLREELTLLYHRVDGRGVIYLRERLPADDGAWAQIYGAAEVTVERGGTSVTLQSQDYDGDTLRGLAETLVRA